ncbi:MAG: symmetrical bis(5'-nucleosyl)-tetraphosphatase [Oxalobacter sp.]|nr:MAG: symmetrical bis(5'-nucleosyl)-tetraphosphatase [Oxalobacter sp.]
MPTYVIGDLQGCLLQTKALLKKIRQQTPVPQLMFVGDLVNRGPSSLQTLRTVRDLGDAARVLLGNHDLHLLAAAHGIRRVRPDDPLQEILQAPDRDVLLDWLRHQPLAYALEGYLLVHAGVLPQWTEEQTLNLAGEVEAVLRSAHWVDFLREMYGDAPAQWCDDLRGVDRLRCIVNALTRLRFCTPDGRMEFETHTGADTAPPGFMPWFEVPGRKTQAVTVVFGHWSTLGLMLRPNVIALDTGCVWGGKLTALRLEDRSVIQVDCPTYQMPGRE